jgi:hypothetical protein
MQNSKISMTEAVLRKINESGKCLAAESYKTKDGRIQFSPMCANKWKNGCLLGKNPQPCDFCKIKRHVPLDAAILDRHITGLGRYGIYPGLPGGTCSLIVSDIDSHRPGQDAAADAKAMILAASDMQIPLMMFSSNSSAGYHAYIFFQDPTPYKIARQLMQAVLDRCEGMTGFDCMKPSKASDDGVGGGLIALPFNGEAYAKRKCTVPLDESLSQVGDTLEDCIEYFDNEIDPLTPERIEELFLENNIQILEEREAEPVDGARLAGLNGQQLSPCVSYILTANPKTEHTNFNKLTMNVVKFMLGAGFDRERATELAARFLDSYPHSGTYVTPQARRQHFSDLWKYLSNRADSQFSCSYILGLGFPGSAFECSRCPLKAGEYEQPESGKKHTPFELVHVGDLTVKPIQWLIRDFIETDSLALLFGDPGTFKSFLSIAFACCVASGKDFHGHSVIQGMVIYIAGEGKNGLARRFKAWAIRNGVDLKSIPLFVSTTPVGLSDPDQVKFVTDTVEKIVAEHGPPRLIVVDTVARNFGPGDENSTKDMSAFVTACDALKGTYGSTVLLVHHCGLSDKTRSRGNIALKAALDAEYRLDKDETSVIRFVATKMKDAIEPEPAAFRPAIVELGEVDGETVTSVVLDPTSYEPPTQSGKEGRGKWQTMAIETLKRLTDKKQNDLEEAGLDWNSARVSFAEWRQECKEKGLTHRETWRRVSDSLIKQERVYLENGFVEAAY